MRTGRAPSYPESWSSVLAEVALTVDLVHDLQRAVIVAVQVGHVLHEVVGLPVEPDGV